VMGTVWWQGPRGLYRGHNAAIRPALFRDLCRLKDLPGSEPFGGMLFCHDQVEAMLIHRAGYAIWELPEEGGSFEGVPPGLIELARRYNRWFAGDLKNVKALKLGARGMDRYHLLAVVHRFFGWPAFLLFVLGAAVAAATWPAGVAFPTRTALLLYGLFLAIYFTPRLLGLADALIAAPDRYGGRLRLVLGGAAEILLTVLITPVAMLSGTLSLARVWLGRKTAWLAPRRGAYRVAWRAAARAFWAETAIGTTLLAALALAAPVAIPWFLPFLAGPVLAIPLAVVSADPALGRWARQIGLCTLPEEIQVPAEVAAVLEREAGKPASARGVL